MASPARRRRVALCTLLVLLAAGLPLPASDGKATLGGRLLDPKGRPARGLNVVVQDVRTLEEFFSPASTEDGAFSLSVPPGASYRIVAAITPRGDRLPVVGAEPVEVPAAGTYTLPDVRFTRRDRSAAAGDSRPWYRTPGGLVGIVTGSTAALIFAFDDDDDDDEDASPSLP
jgi:hypothetical protein